jgi:hypothetical protein
MITRPEHGTRCDFAKAQFHKLIKGWTENDYISGKRSYKIAQARRIYIHYRKFFNRKLPSRYTD